MKNIAVIVYNCSTEYNSTVVQGITSYFKDKPDAHCIVSTVYIPDPKSSEFDYQYWTSVKVLSSEYIDAVIVVTNSFTDYLSTETLTKKLSLFANKPVISVSVPLELPKNYYTHTSCEQSYCQTVEHLVKKHNRKKIAFFSAELNGSYEGVERFEAYKHALEKNNLFTSLLEQSGSIPNILKYVCVMIDRLVEIKFPNLPGTDLASVIPDASSEAIDLMSQMLRWDPNKRATAHNLLQHPFFTKYTIEASISSGYNFRDEDRGKCKRFTNKKHNIKVQESTDKSNFGNYENKDKEEDTITNMLNSTDGFDQCKLLIIYNLFLPL